MSPQQRCTMGTRQKAIQTRARVLPNGGHAPEDIRPDSEPDLPLAVIRGCDWLQTIISPNTSQKCESEPPPLPNRKYQTWFDINDSMLGHLQRRPTRKSRLASTTRYFTFYSDNTILSARIPPIFFVPLFAFWRNTTEASTDRTDRFYSCFVLKSHLITRVSIYLWDLVSVELPLWNRCHEQQMCCLVLLTNHLVCVDDYTVKKTTTLKLSSVASLRSVCIAYTFHHVLSVFTVECHDSLIRRSFLSWLSSV